MIGLKLVDDSVFAEAYYNGSSFGGGGIMSAIATYRIVVRDSATGRVISRRTEERNVSLAADWDSSDPSIYPYLYYPGQTLNDVVYDAPDDLWVYGGDSPAVGTTTITATFAGFTATGTITFWAD